MCWGCVVWQGGGPFGGGWSVLEGRARVRQRLSREPGAGCWGPGALGPKPGLPAGRGRPPPSPTRPPHLMGMAALSSTGWGFMISSTSGSGTAAAGAGASARLASAGAGGVGMQIARAPRAGQRARPGGPPRDPHVQSRADGDPLHRSAPGVAAGGAGPRARRCCCRCETRGRRCARASAAPHGRVLQGREEAPRERWAVVMLVCIVASEVPSGLGVPGGHV